MYSETLVILLSKIEAYGLCTGAQNYDVIFLTLNLRRMIHCVHKRQGIGGEAGVEIKRDIAHG